MEGEGFFGEGGAPPLVLPGEGGVEPPAPPSVHYIFEEVIKDKKLTFEEASRCLNTLGKDESGVRYAYLMITATDMKLTDVSVVLNFKHVLFLDLSGNYLDLDALQVVSQMPFLILLKAERNRVESAALNQCDYLQVLDLNSNKITETCDISQRMLECLDLEFNQIFTIQFDSQRLPCLKTLDLVGNHLVDVSGSFPLTIESLYLAQNKISKINSADVSKLTQLKVLHLRDNKIRKLNGFTANLSNLTYLNLRNNKINKVRQFRKLTILPKLEVLIILGNPVQGEQKSEEIKGEADEDEEVFGEEEATPKDLVRLGILVLLPNLKRLNKEVVTLEEKEEAFIMKDTILQNVMGEESSEDEEEEPPTTTEATTEYTSETETEGEFARTFRDPGVLEEEEEM